MENSSGDSPEEPRLQKGWRALLVLTSLCLNPRALLHSRTCSGSNTRTQTLQPRVAYLYSEQPQIP